MSPSRRTDKMSQDKMSQDLMSPGRSFYEDSVWVRPSYPAFTGEMQTDVAIIGGGFTGLSAAYHLARGGVRVALFEKRRFGGGASGRNGGQFGTGQRQWVEELEEIYGFERTKALFDMAEAAKAYLLDFAAENHIEMDYQKGQLSVAHQARHVNFYAKHVEVMARYGYNKLHFMTREETRERLGSSRYFGGVRDEGTGHIHPLKLVVGTAQAASKAGAILYEKTGIEEISQCNGKIELKTSHGHVKAEKLLLATNGYSGHLVPEVAARLLPIRSFIGATPPLDSSLGILPGGEAVDDSRFAVRYFRKTPSNRLLFGGSEAYGRGDGNQHARVRAQMLDIFPQLGSLELTHIWGGTVGITVERMPFVREMAPNIVFCGGYSGHGVMLSHYCGFLYACSILGTLKEPLRLLQELKISKFPGGRLRAPLLFLALSWFALLDRL